MSVELELELRASEFAINRKWKAKGLLSQQHRENIKLLAAEIRTIASEHFEGPVRVAIGFQGAKCDVDAPVKALLDAIQKSKCISNDEQINDLRVVRGDCEASPLILILVEAGPPLHLGWDLLR